MSGYVDCHSGAGGPAFPQVLPECADQGPVAYHGMSLRDYFAAKAMASMAGGSWPDGNERLEIARRAYLLADEMLKARKA